MPASKNFRDHLEPVLDQAQAMIARLAAQPGGNETATDPEVSRLAIERWISDTRILMDLADALERDGRFGDL